jgi:hypothetical protein
MNNRQKHGMIATNMNKHPYFCSQFLIVKWKIKIRIYRVIHERGISEFLFAATHYTHCNNILISNFENNYN